ncbi:hypothetical protein DER46DRAFT_650478 [Fusarium sp. MPI-SDFR-AT-0072]|nr:hypothetical protein DER46DRAFT_650478 [Fusarium sp. MPI-SDFR-AT-0072]
MQSGLGRTITPMETIRASTVLTRKYPEVYDFKIYDVDGHKIWCYVKQFTTIDSNSKLGSVIKPPGDPWSLNGKFYIWKSNGSAEVRIGKQNRHIGEDSSHGKPVKRFLVLSAQKVVEVKNEEEEIWRIVWCEGLPGYQDELGTVATKAQRWDQVLTIVQQFGSVEQWKADDYGLGSPQTEVWNWWS